jgi:DNA-binding transcriptional ArsR family regulator
MVKYPDGHLDRIFGALGNPTRRAILARLSREPGLSISDLAAPFDVGLPAVMKHLDVLSDAGLVTRRKNGRTVSVEMMAKPMREAMGWLDRYTRFWSAGLDRLAAFAEAEEMEQRKKER